MEIARGEIAQAAGTVRNNPVYGRQDCSKAWGIAESGIT